MNIASDKVISTILKHDTKVTSYKIALLRAINDVVLTYSDLRTYQSDVAGPLKLVAEFWIAYYWPFVDTDNPIQQGQRAQRQEQTTNDMAFRPALTTRLPLLRFSPGDAAIAAIAKTIQMPRCACIYSNF